MKKNILFWLGLLLIPLVITGIFCLARQDLQLGRERAGMCTKMGKSVQIELHGLYKTMDVEEYVTGVLAGVIPADYDPEMLKVQAVLVRTNVLREMEEKGSTDAADLTYTYLTLDERMELWGERNYERNQKRMERAVRDTAGLVLRQEGNLILAMYHEVSTGKTASAKEITGTDISYLQSVDSSQDVEAKHYMNFITLKPEEIREGMQQEEKADKEDKTEPDTESEPATETEASQTEAPEIVIEESTEHGFVKRILVDGIALTGEEAMEAWKLPSMNFYVEQVKDGIRFVCLGKGSCLGVSQYGANYMAMQGASMEDILSYYYKNVSLEKFEMNAKN